MTPFPYLVTFQAPNETAPTSTFSDDEIERLNKYLTLQSKVAFSWGRYLLKKCLSQLLDIKERDLQFSYNLAQKPYIKDSPIQFNLSHSQSRIAIGFDTEYCGCDCEHIKPLKNQSDLFKKISSKKEIALLKNHFPKEKAFFIAWTCKESISKQLGESFFSLYSSLETTHVNQNKILLKSTKTNQTFTCYWVEENNTIYTLNSKRKKAPILIEILTPHSFTL